MDCCHSIRLTSLCSGSKYHLLKPHDTIDKIYFRLPKLHSKSQVRDGSCDHRLKGNLAGIIDESLSVKRCLSELTRRRINLPKSGKLDPFVITQFSNANAGLN